MKTLVFVLLAVSCLAVVECTVPNLVRPSRLQVGDTIGFISPASPIVLEVGNLTAYKQNLESAMRLMGLKVEYSPNSFADGPGGLAGTDAQRASDVMWAFNTPHIKGIIANRGGWGCNRIVDKFDYSAIARNPKIFMGYSDLTGCMNAITQQTGLSTFHGPMGLSTWTGTLNAVYMNDLLIQAQSNTLFVSKTQTKTIVSGKAKGRLIGGNLSVFHALLGTPYFPSMDEPYIVFLEDVGEKTYNVDRMLTSLHLHGLFKNAQGLIWGQCTDCPQGGDFSIDQLLQQKWGSLTSVPSFSGAMIGHIHEQFTLPIGGLAEMDANAGTIRLTQASVL
jgi:muramoyltetrapeptide carboxypeptidase